MESGILEGENFAAVLRGVSQRRRQGILEIQEDSGTKKICFVQGKVVEFLNPNSAPALEVAHLLQKAGVIASLNQVLARLPDNGAAPFGYKELYEALKGILGADVFSVEVFKRVIKHRLLECLYSLNTQSLAAFNFSVQMVEYEKDYVSTVSPGQVLLDKVALDTESDRFYSAFPLGCKVSLVSSPGEALSEEEWVLSELMHDEISLTELKTMAMLSSYHFQEAMLALLDRGLISVTLPQEDSSSEPLLAADALAAIDGAVDEAFAARSQGNIGAETESADSEIMEQPASRSPSAIIAALDSGFKLKMRTWSGSLLQKAWVPGALAIVFALASILFPVLFWRGALLGFAR